MFSQELCTRQREPVHLSSSSPALYQYLQRGLLGASTRSKQGASSPPRSCSPSQVHPCQAFQVVAEASSRTFTGKSAGVAPAGTCLCSGLPHLLLLLPDCFCPASGLSPRGGQLL